MSGWKKDGVNKSRLVSWANAIALTDMCGECMSGYECIHYVTNWYMRKTNRQLSHSRQWLWRETSTKHPSGCWVILWTTQSHTIVSLNKAVTNCEYSLLREYHETRVNAVKREQCIKPECCVLHSTTCDMVARERKLISIYHMYYCHLQKNGTNANILNCSVSEWHDQSVWYYFGHSTPKLTHFFTPVRI